MENHPENPRNDGESCFSVMLKSLLKPPFTGTQHFRDIYLVEMKRVQHLCCIISTILHHSLYRLHHIFTACLRSLCNSTTITALVGLHLIAANCISRPNCSLPVLHAITDVAAISARKMLPRPPALSEKTPYFYSHLTQR